MTKKTISEKELLTCDLKIEHKSSTDWIFMFENSKGEFWFTDMNLNRIELPVISNPTIIEDKENGYALTISV